MGVAYRRKVAHFSDIVTVEDAEGLLEWLQKNPKGKVDLSECTHLHSANLQALMAAQPAVAAWPNDANLCLWLQSALISI